MLYTSKLLDIELLWKCFQLHFGSKNLIRNFGRIEKQDLSDFHIPKFSDVELSNAIKFTFPFLRYHIKSCNEIWWCKSIEHEFCFEVIIILTIFVCLMYNVQILGCLLIRELYKAQTSHSSAASDTNHPKYYQTFSIELQSSMFKLPETMTS